MGSITPFNEKNITPTDICMFKATLNMFPVNHLPIKKCDATKIFSDPNLFFNMIMILNRAYPSMNLPMTIVLKEWINPPRQNTICPKVNTKHTRNTPYLNLKDKFLPCSESVEKDPSK